MKSRHDPHTITTALIAGSLLFAGAYHQWPLFTSNQNTYFLIGLAKAGYGYLSEDWLAKQTDHIPVFSQIVSYIHSLGSHWLFYCTLFILAAIYASSLSIIASRVLVCQWSAVHTTVLFALMTLLHCMWVLYYFANSIPGILQIIPPLEKLASLFTNGVAGQYILGRILQPSAFGVFLITSIGFFLYKMDLAAVFCAVLSATIHGTYILHAGILIAAYTIVLLIEKRTRRAILVASLAALLIMPTILYIVIMLYHTDPSVAAKAQSILVELRIPHHAKIAVWFSRETSIQVALIIAGVIASYRSRRLFFVLIFSLIAGIGLTLLSMVSGNMSLALLFPWRVSTWLIPISAAILLAWLTAVIVELMNHIVPSLWLPRIKLLTISFCVAFIAGTCFVGLRRTIESAISQQNEVVCFAKTHSTSGQTYLVPLQHESFRLNSGIPVFVDWKSHPFKPDEVLEWYRRVELARAFYQASNPNDAFVALESIQKMTRITHVIVERKHENILAALHCQPVYLDADYIVAKLIGNEMAEQ